MLGTKVQKVKLRVDKRSAIELSNNPVHHERSKHIDLRYHYIRECVELGRVDVIHVRTGDQVADIFTKSLGRSRYAELRHKLGVIQCVAD